jgi:hypothetical protein
MYLYYKSTKRTKVQNVYLFLDVFGINFLYLVFSILQGMLEIPKKNKY